MIVNERWESGFEPDSGSPIYKTILNISLVYITTFSSLAMLCPARVLFLASLSEFLLFQYFLVYTYDLQSPSALCSAHSFRSCLEGRNISLRF